MYRIRQGFVLRQIVDDYIIVATGSRSVEFSSVMVLNEVGVTVFRQLQAERTPQEIADGIAAEYGISGELALADVMKFIGKLMDDGVCEHV